MNNLEYSSNDIKQLYRSVYSLIKYLDEQKVSIRSLHELFNNEDISQKRTKLVQKCEILLFQDQGSIGRKSREILWRKGYYDWIVLIKKLLRYSSAKQKEDDNNDEKLKSTADELKCVENFLADGIKCLKNIITQLEITFDLDLLYVIDLTIVDENLALNKSKNEPVVKNNINQKTTSLDTINYALETIHAILISVGDLHRYYLDLGLDQQHIFDQDDQSSKPITRNLASKYYLEAFKLNPKIGMSQNQLGTLLSGQKYNLDSVYHYLYSLVCSVPFEMSEDNVNKIFQQNANYLETLDFNDQQSEDNADDKMLTICTNVKNFIARFILIVDIFFYDKEVTDFNNLCHVLLIDLNHLLKINNRKLKEKNDFVTSDVLFKMTSILFFCMSKLQQTNSTKIYSLNAFLVAICAQYLDSCISNVETYIAKHQAENLIFQECYSKLYEEFDCHVKQTREEYRLFNEKSDNDKSIVQPKLLSTASSLSSPPSARRQQRQKNLTTSVDVNHLNSSCSYRNNASDDVLSMNGLNSQPKKGHENDDDQNKDSDCKNSQLSKLSGNCNKKKQTKLRRRRKCRQISYSGDDSDLTSNFDSDSDSEYNYSDSDSSSSPFSSDEYETDDEGNDQDNEDMDDEINGDTTEVIDDNLNPLNGHNNQNVMANDKNDDEDVIVEEESVVYVQPPDTENKSAHSELSKISAFNDFSTINLNGLTFNCNDDDTDDVVIEEEKIIYPHQEIQSNLNECNGIDKESQSCFDEPDSCPEIIDKTTNQPIKLKYKISYGKIDPNIILNFAKTEITLPSLKILCDWLKNNRKIIAGCYETNPEFIQKIMKLLNYFNIDVFTSKVYFDTKKMLKINKVREDLENLFAIRRTIPLTEDYMFKNFEIFQSNQQQLDWEISSKLKITTNEEVTLRIFKLIDFGFSLSKSNKFNYSFCVKTRNFEEHLIRKTRKRKRMHRRNRRNRRQQQNKYQQINGNDRNHGLLRHRERRQNRKPSIELTKSIPSSDLSDFDQNNKNGTVVPSMKKGYLKNKTNSIITLTSTAIPNDVSTERNGENTSVILSENNGNVEKSKDNIDLSKSKHQIMGQLWLRSEVKSLESKIKQPTSFNLTPYLMMDSKSLTEYTAFVKTLIKAKKFIVLIPNAVLSELDELKKHSDKARNVIRWLEQEFSKGNRFLRSQRINENLPLPLVKIPKKLDREASEFIQIIQFCNHIVNEQLKNDNASEILTLLTGDNLIEKKCSYFSYSGILDSIPVKFERIATFYAKYKKK